MRYFVVLVGVIVGLLGGMLATQAAVDPLVIPKLPWSVIGTDDTRTLVVDFRDGDQRS
jgi:hypothetical protein